MKIPLVGQLLYAGVVSLKFECVTLSLVLLPEAWMGVKSLYAQSQLTRVRWRSVGDDGLVSGETLIFGARDTDLKLGFVISGIWFKLVFFRLKRQ